MRHPLMSALAATAVVACALCISTAHAAGAAWIEESNRYAQWLLDAQASYQPEYSANIGVEGHDGDVLDLKPRYAERAEADLAAAAAKLDAARATVTDERVKQDLRILVQAAHQAQRTSELNRQLMIPYFDLGRALFSGFQDLLDARVPKKRQAAALVRLRRYAGKERGYEPITSLARARIEERMGDASLTWPWVVEVQQDLDNSKRYVDGMRDLLQKSGLKGWQNDFAALTRQLEEHAAWVRATVLPHARKTNQLPLAIYSDNLKIYGVDADPHDVMQHALFAYMQTRDEMDSLARAVAAERHYESTNYRDVLRNLKKERVPADKVLELYTSHLAKIEAIIRREHIISLPARAAVIRLATEAETAASPAPHLDPPRLIGNTGEPGEFVLPTKNPNAATNAAMDDFDFEAISWAVTAHEARPGHELQFAAMLERGVSTARVVFAFNSANVEGWALYCEAIMKQYLPLEGQIGALQLRLLRTARAYLDPMLNLGLIEPNAAKRILMNEVGLSEPFAKTEIDRYTFGAPGQATSYFYGYSRLEALRARAEIALGERFAAQPYHDFIINEGLLPLELLEQAVMTRFVQSQR
jgi:Bacterial protein of unknown function (DUF885)